MPSSDSERNATWRDGLIRSSSRLLAPTRATSAAKAIAPMPWSEASS
jgi:hypothetical protein